MSTGWINLSKSATLKHQLTNSETAFFSPLLLPNKEKLLAIHRNNTKAAIWNISTGKKLLRLLPDEGVKFRYQRTNTFSHNEKYFFDRFRTSKINTFRFWDLETGKLVNEVDAKFDSRFVGDIIDAEFCPNDSLIAIGTQRDMTAVLRVPTGEIVWHFNHKIHSLLGLDFTPDGRFLLIHGNHFLEVRDLSTGEQIMEFEPEQRSSVAASFDKSGKYFFLPTYAPNSHAELTVYDFETKQSKHTFKDGLPFGRFKKIDLFDNPHLFATNNILWDLEKGEKVVEFKLPICKLLPIAFDTTGNFLIVNKYKDGKQFVETLSLSSMKTIFSEENHLRYWNSSNEKFLVPVTGKAEGMGYFKLMDGYTGNQVGQINLAKKGDFVYHYEVDSQQKRAITLSRGIVKSWKIENGEELNTFSTNGPTQELVLSSDDQFLAIIPSKDSIRMSKFSSGERYDTFEGTMMSAFSGYDQGGYFTNSSKHFIYSRKSKKTNLYDVVAKKTLYEIDANFKSLHPTKSKFLTSSFENQSEFQIRDLLSGKIIHTFKSDEKIYKIFYAPDGKTILAFSEKENIFQWESETGNLLWKKKHGIKGHPEAPIFHPSGKYFVVSTNKIYGDKQGLYFFDTNTGEKILELYWVFPDEWVAVTPQGHFDGTPDGLKAIYYSNGITTKTLNEFPLDFKVTDLMKKVFSQESLPEIDLQEGFYLKK